MGRLTGRLTHERRECDFEKIFAGIRIIHVQINRDPPVLVYICVVGIHTDSYWYKSTFRRVVNLHQWEPPILLEQNRFFSTQT